MNRGSGTTVFFIFLKTFKLKFSFSQNILAAEQKQWRLKPTFIHHIFHGGLAGAVHVAGEGGVLYELVVVDGGLHLRLGHEVVRHAVLLARTRRPERVKYFLVLQNISRGCWGAGCGGGDLIIF